MLDHRCDMPRERTIKRQDNQAPGPIGNLIIQYGGVARLAKALREFAGLEGLSHSTVSRWENSEINGDAIPRKAERAIALLAPKGDPTIRLAYHDAPVALPFMLLPELHKDFTVVVPEDMAGTGLAALEKLAAGEADVTFAWRHAKPDPSTANKCARLSGFVDYHLGGIFKEKVTKRNDLRNKKIGYPAGSAVKEFLGNHLDFEPLLGLDPKGYPNPEAAANAMAIGEASGLIGWEPWLSKARKELQNRGAGADAPYDLPHGLLPPIHLDLFVRRSMRSDSCGKDVVLRFLHRLSNLIDVPGELDKQVKKLEQDSPEKLKVIGERLGLSGNEALSADKVLKFVENYNFGLTNVDLNLLFAIWRESTT